MRHLSAFASLLFAVALAHGQAVQPTTPIPVRMAKYILGVADLDHSYVFYHALGLELNNAAALGQPSPLPEMLLKLVDVPAGTKFRNMMLKIPTAPFALEVTEFSNMDLHPARPRIQDPGATLLMLAVDQLDAAMANAKKAGAEVVSTGGSGALLKDPDGYYVELTQPGLHHISDPGLPPGTGKVIGAAFNFVVPDCEKAAAFYRQQFGFAFQTTEWTSGAGANLGTPGAQVRSANGTVAGTTLSWGFFEFKGADRKPYASRIPDPGAPAIGLQVRDMDAAIAAMKAAGGSSITQGGSLQLGGNGKVGFVRDPNGILVEFAQP